MKLMWRVMLIPFFATTAVAVEVAPASTQLNAAFSKVLSGSYVSETLGEVFEDISYLWRDLPFEIDPIEGEVNRLIRRESARYARGLISKELGGFVPLGVASFQPGSTFNLLRTPQKKKSHPFHIKTTVSARRLALSLIFRF